MGARSHKEARRPAGDPTMNTFTLERKLAAPVCCLHCGWLGKVGNLRSRGTDPAGIWKCPRCNGSAIKWIENDPPAAIQ